MHYPGISRESSGPDFKDAVLETDTGDVVCGDVEVHVHASDWYGHGHASDSAYDRVVLHVVERVGSGSPTLLSSGRQVPVAVVAHTRGVMPGLPCSSVWACDPAHVGSVLRSAGYERLRWRASTISNTIRDAGPTRALGSLVARVLGYSANARPLQSLGEHICEPSVRAGLNSVSIEERRKLVLTIAGLLPCHREPGHVPANGEGTPVISPAEWRFHGMYPNNHPVRRTVALADMLPFLEANASAMVEWGRNPRALVTQAERLFIVAGDGYWRRHYDFGLATPDADLIGPSKARAIVVEGVLPWLVALSAVTGDTSLRRNVIAAYARCRGGPMNSVLRHMSRQLGIERRFITPLTGQGLHHLFNEYCTRGLCCVCPLAAVHAPAEAVS
ncbi:MAG: DUF2851 family protein [Chloroflexota bacterium]